MKVKLKKQKKSPAPVATEQAKEKRNYIFDENSTIKKNRRNTSTYGVPNYVVYDDYKSTTSKSSW